MAIFKIDSYFLKGETFRTHRLYLFLVEGEKGIYEGL